METEEENFDEEVKEVEADQENASNMPDTWDESDMKLVETPFSNERHSQVAAGNLNSNVTDVSGSRESSFVLHEIFDTVKESTTTLRTLQEMTKGLVQTQENLTSELQQTNQHLQRLINILAMQITVQGPNNDLGRNGTEQRAPDVLMNSFNLDPKYLIPVENKYTPSKHPKGMVDPGPFTDPPCAQGSMLEAIYNTLPRVDFNWINESHEEHGENEQLDGQQRPWESYVGKPNSVQVSDQTLLSSIQQPQELGESNPRDQRGGPLTATQLCSEDRSQPSNNNTRRHSEPELLAPSLLSSVSKDRQCYTDVESEEEQPTNEESIGGDVGATKTLSNDFYTEKTKDNKIRQMFLQEPSLHAGSGQHSRDNNKHIFSDANPLQQSSLKKEEEDTTRFTGKAKTGQQSAHEVNGASNSTTNQQGKTQENITVMPVNGWSQSKDVRPKTFNSQDHSDKTRSSEQHRTRSSRSLSALGLQLTSTSESESKRLREALDRAQVPEETPSPKARSFDTVLCLDTSNSMWDGSAFTQMIATAKTFINGIEDAANEVEENIAVVTFGGTADIIQHLTNDFARARDALDRIKVGGKSPFYEAMVVCLAAISGRGGIVSVSGEYDVHPRIIFITDGHITEGSDDPEASDRVVDPTNTRAHFSRLMLDLNRNNNPSMPHPIIFVPVGNRPNKIFLESQAKLNDGQIVEADNITSLCNYYKVQETIGKMIVCLHSRDATRTNDEHTKALVKALVPSVDDDEMIEIVHVVNQELQKPGRGKSKHVRPTDFDEVFEDKEGVLCGNRLSLGTRVIRGPDWKWGNQDGEKPGTVIQHEENKYPFTWVLWDNGGWNRYPYGEEMGYHIWKTLEHPVLRQEDGQFQIGMTVKMGPLWTEPVPSTNSGIIIRMSKDRKKVKVRWDNGDIAACSTDAIEFRDPFENLTENDSHRQNKNNFEDVFGTTHKEEEEIDEDKIWVWQWRDGFENWRLYTHEQIEQLEKEYKRRRTGTCIIQRDGKSYRVMFNCWRERDVEKKMETAVIRSKIFPEEYKSLQLAERLSTSQ